MPMINNMIDTRLTAWQGNMLWINIEFWLLKIIGANYDLLNQVPLVKSQINIHQSRQENDHKIGNARII
jgi:hypothetical protein